MITDATGTEVWRWDSAPFGETLPNEQPASQPTKFVFNQRFPGQYYDQETGLHYNYFRDYDPSTGRYVESDPIGLGGGNTFGYVVADPIRKKDPKGLEATTCAVGGPCDPGDLDNTEDLNWSPSWTLPEYLRDPHNACMAKCDLVVASPCKVGASKTPGFPYGPAAVYIVCNMVVHRICEARCKDAGKECPPVNRPDNPNWPKLPPIVIPKRKNER